MSDPKLWVNLDGKVVHPDAPSGGGGPGRFKSANPLGSSDPFLSGVPDPSSPDGRNVPLTDKQKEQILNADAGLPVTAPAKVRRSRSPMAGPTPPARAARPWGSAS